MKTKYLIGKLVVLVALLTLGCKKENIDSPEFDVTVHKNTFKLGDTVTFNMQGEPDYVSFYSGEYLNEYAFVEGRSLEIQSFSASFQSRVQNGTQANQLSVFVSNDFNGKYDMASIKAGNFIDITNKFTLGSVNAVYAASGTLDLAPYVTDKTKPVYFAFRYSGKPQTAANGVIRTWTIRDFAFNTITDQGPRVAANQLTAAWTLVEAGAILDPGRSSISDNGQLNLRGNSSAEGKLVETEHWAVSKALDLSTVNLGPDRSVPIKGISETLPSVYKYIYTKPGSYKASFAVSNERIEGKKTAVKEISITITP